MKDPEKWSLRSTDRFLMFSFAAPVELELASAGARRKLALQTGSRLHVYRLGQWIVQYRHQHLNILCLNGSAAEALKIKVISTDPAPAASFSLCGGDAGQTIIEDYVEHFGSLVLTADRMTVTEADGLVSPKPKPAPPKPKPAPPKPAPAPPKPAPAPPKPENPADQQELAMLRAENEKLQMLLDEANKRAAEQLNRSNKLAVDLEMMKVILQKQTDLAALCANGQTLRAVVDKLQAELDQETANQAGLTAQRDTLEEQLRSLQEKRVSLIAAREELTDLDTEACLAKLADHRKELLKDNEVLSALAGSGIRSSSVTAAQEECGKLLEQIEKRMTDIISLREKIDAKILSVVNTGEQGGAISIGQEAGDV